MKFIFLIFGLVFIEIGFGLTHALIYDDYRVVVVIWTISLLFKIGGTWILGTVGNVWRNNE